MRSASSTRFAIAVREAEQTQKDHDGDEAALDGIVEQFPGLDQVVGAFILVGHGLGDSEIAQQIGAL